MQDLKAHILDILPSNLEEVARRPWIPWHWIGHRHRDRPSEQIIAIFEAYRIVLDALDFEELTRGLMPATEEDGCRRCGSCCAELLPDPVWPADMARWKEDGNPLIHFYIPEDPELPGSRLTGYACGGVRLRLCPFLFWHPGFGDTFCVLHPLGPDQRPEACSSFVPNYPHCAISQRPIVW